MGVSKLSAFFFKVYYSFNVQSHKPTKPLFFFTNVCSLSDLRPHC